MQDDHIPPKNLFPKPRPSDLITVPACSTCHKPTSKDDEYFRLKLCMSDKVGDDTSARQARESILRSLQRSEATGMQRAFLADMRSAFVATPSGRLRQRLAFDVDLRRLFRVVERTVRGLAYHERKERIKSYYRVQIHSDDSLTDTPTEVYEELRSTILLPLARVPPKEVARGDFAYRWIAASDDAHSSAWALTFYKQVSFLALVGSRRHGADKTG
jgi:hypothetical protein